MMNKLFTLFTVILISLCLCGCHGEVKEKAQFEVPEEFDTSKNYEITFWAKNDSNARQVAVYKKAIEDFNEYYPNIKVNLSLYTDYTKIYNDVITNISTNTTPNVCITYPDHIATYLTGNNVVVPLDELIDDETFGLGKSGVKFDAPTREEMVSEFLDEGMIDGVTYAIPFMRSSEALYINKTYVEKLGYEIPDTVTWDWIFEVSKDAAARKNEDGTYYVNNQEVLIPFIYKSTDNMMIQMLKQLKADYSDENGNILIFNDTTKSILMEVADLVTEGAFSTFKKIGYPANFLNVGQCIFAVDSTGGATWMGSDAPLVDVPEENIVRFETVVKEIPQYDTENIQMISQGPSICIFNKEDSGEVLASWLFTQYLLTNDIQSGYSKTEGYVPVTLKCQKSDEYQDYLSKSGIDNDEHYSIKIDAAKLVNRNIENTFVTPVFNGSASLRNAAGQLIEEVVKGIGRKKTVDEAFVKELYSDINSLYRLDQTSGIDSSKDLGELPVASKMLIASLVSIWLGIGAYELIEIRKKKTHK